MAKAVGFWQKRPFQLKRWHVPVFPETRYVKLVDFLAKGSLSGEDPHRQTDGRTNTHTKAAQAINSLGVFFCQCKGAHLDDHIPVWKKVHCSRGREAWVQILPPLLPL